MSSSLKHQLVKLSVDIEDKDKSCQLLRHKVEKEIAQLNNAETTYQDEFQSSVEVISCS